MQTGTGNANANMGSLVYFHTPNKTRIDIDYF